MGKPDEELALSVRPISENEDNAGGIAAGDVGCRQCGWIRRILRTRCAVTVALGLVVLVCVIFWIPPFLRDRAEEEREWGTAADGFGADIIASFKLHRSVSELNKSVPELQYEIYKEIGVPNSSVVVISILPLGQSNWSSVVFGVLPYPTNSAISSAAMSIIRSYFMSFVIQQSTLLLTPSLFGTPFFFHVLEFPRGITIIPPQKVFLLQKIQITFNFTLNFSIDQVLEKIGQLKDQMRTGLHLSSNENVYVSLTNMLGSTVSPPTIVQTSIMPAVGTPTKSRLKELTKAIAGSSTKNLGLNHTLFGRVKQVSLSTYLQHSVNGSGPSIPPSSTSPAPQPNATHKHHHRHHHHHHHHHLHEHSLAPSPMSPPKSAPVFPLNPHSSYPPPPKASSYAGSSPFPVVSFGNVQSPRKNVTHGNSPDILPSSWMGKSKDKGKLPPKVLWQGFDLFNGFLYLSCICWSVCKDRSSIPFPTSTSPVASTVTLYCSCCVSD